MTDKLREAAQQALEALETVLSDAYHRRFLECCGRPGIECCGNPNEAWTPEDNKIMDLLSPAQRQLSEALRVGLYLALPAAMPAGYALVPVEPTQAMLDAAGMSSGLYGKEWLDQSNREVWASMLTAARKGE